MKIVCVSAGNIIHSGCDSVSYTICRKIAGLLRQKSIICDIIDLREYSLVPCTGCGGCYDSRRCCCDSGFNQIYEKIIKSDGIFFAL